MNKKVYDKPNIVFMGTPMFACVVLKTLYDAGYPISLVFSQPDKPVGRGNKIQSPPVALFAKEKGLNLLQPARIRQKDVLEHIKSTKPDFIVVAAYGKILSKEILESPHVDAINVHASLLPEYRGAAPINYALMDGKTHTGVSIMRIVEEMDAGPIYLKRQISIKRGDHAVCVTEKLAQLGGEVLLEALPLIFSKSLKPVDQDPLKVSYAPKLTKEISSISWSCEAEKTFNLIRALVPWPVATTQLLGKKIKIFESEVLQLRSSGKPGSIVHISKDGWTVTTGTTDLLIKEVQIEGKKRMNAFDLANGLRLRAGSVFNE